MRIVNEEILSFTDKYYSREYRPLYILYEAPTGYGKSTLALLIGKTIADYGYSYSYIHVLPMRSIVRNLYNRLEILKPPLDRLGITSDDIGYQASGFSFSGKDPFLARKYTITTIDSFFLNLSKIGIGEWSIFTRHYEASRTMIFTSTTTFDEVHLYGGDPGSPEDILYTSLVLSIESVALARNPVIITTATLPTLLGEDLYRRLKDLARQTNGEAIWISYGRKVEPKTTSLAYIDREYDSIVDSAKWKTKLLIDKDNSYSFINNIVSDYMSGKRVLVVVNKPRRAIEVYNRLSSKGCKPLLVHGRMTYGDREVVEKELENSKLLVATQVVEAGIDVSYDVLYTDIAPPSNLVQRVGRIIRSIDEMSSTGVGYVNIIVGGYSDVYKRDIIVETISVLKNILDRGLYINWRSYKNTSSYIGFTSFLDRVYSTTKKLSIDHTYLNTFRDYIRSYMVLRRRIIDTLIRSCIQGRGVTRSTVLVPLILIDSDEKHDIDTVTRNTIPVSLSWILSRVEKKVLKELYVVTMDQEGVVNDYRLSDSLLETNKLRSMLCRWTIFSRYNSREYFIGLGINPTLYKRGIGLLL